MKLLRPGTREWSDINPDLSTTSEEVIKVLKSESEKAANDLKDMLLSSLQMQNLCGLAGSGTSLGVVAGPSMSDLWNRAAKNEQSVIHEQVTAVAALINFNLTVEYPNIEEFLSLCDSYLEFNVNENVKSLIKNFKKKIIEECSFVNDNTDLTGHEAFIHRLSRRRIRDTRLKLFTTNYDLCFERASGNLGLVLVDGFSFTQPRSYDPRFFGYDIVRRPRTGEDLGNYLEGVVQLYKLHGSVSWARKASQIIEKLKPDAEEACLIYPAKGKYQQSYIQPHLELMSQYLMSLREPNTCIIAIGFGFNDDHLSEPLLAAVKSNSHLRLIVVDFKAEQNVNSGSGSAYWQKLKELALQGEDVWFVNASFQDFSKFIPDLRSLSKADRLAKDIRSLAGGN